ncbi:hypothetical protein FRC02_002357 [Tulasnella sp. 418]|nr:hypothetical protein FRC02_002357 [Tulasnella sp. 418]
MAVVLASTTIGTGGGTEEQSQPPHPTLSSPLPYPNPAPPSPGIADSDEKDCVPVVDIHETTGQPCDDKTYLHIWDI